MMRKVFANIYLWILLLVLYTPILIIFVFSLTESKVLGQWTGFSFGLYANLIQGTAGTALNNAIINTLIIAFSAATISTLLGTVAAIGIFNLRQRQRKAVTFLNSIPMINPDIITGVSLFLLFVFLGIPGGMFTIICAHVAFCTPYVVLSVMPRLTKMNPSIYEAALDLGATPQQALRKD
ncbi:MAG: ABC transporter permease subunit, partial [Paludibacteraceae bacterium]|nr:ABC transporter permease subunit [Paludibacteraceae bacterium]